MESSDNLLRRLEIDDELELRRLLPDTEEGIRDDAIDEGVEEHDGGDRTYDDKTSTARCVCSEDSE